MSHDGLTEELGATLAPGMRALLGRGLTNREIAEQLVVSERTAGNYVQRVLNRLGLHNRVQVAAWAVEHGLHEKEPSAPDRLRSR